MSKFKVINTKINKDLLNKFISTVFKHVESEEEHNFFTCHKEAIEPGNPWYSVPFRQIESGDNNFCYHYCISTFALEGEYLKRKKQNWTGLHVIVLDDVGTKAKPNNIEPTYVIETSENNFQWGYVLSEPIRDVKIAEKVISLVYGKTSNLSDRGGAQITKMVKLPIGFNLKKNKPSFAIKLHELNDLTYTWQELLHKWGFDEISKSIINNEDVLFNWLNAQGLILSEENNGYFKVDCPRGDEHSDGGSTAFYSPIGYGDNNIHQARVFKCFHEHRGDPVTTYEFIAFHHLDGAPLVEITNYNSDDDRAIMPKSQFPDVKVSKNNVKILKTILNLQALLKWYDISCFFDVYSKDIKLHIPWISENLSMDSMVIEIYSLCQLCDWDMPVATLMSMLRRIASNCQENVISQWLMSLPDNVEQRDYLKELFELLPIAFSEYVAEDAIELEKYLILSMIKFWFIQCCAAADMCKLTSNKEALLKYESVLVFVSKQGIGKTKFFQKLLPEKLSSYVCTGAILDLKSLDSIRQATACFICELGELDSTFSRSDISQLKAFLSKSVDTYRLPYAVDAQSYTRMTSFCGSVNDKDFLRDMTGNRRFWVIELEDFIPEISSELITSCWKQAYDLYLSGAQWWFDKQHYNDMQKYADQFVFYHEDVVIDKIIKTFGEINEDTIIDGVWLTISEIFDCIGMNTPSKAESMKVANYLKNRVSIEKRRQIFRIGRANVRKFCLPKLNQNK